MPNAFAHLMLFGWPVVTVILFARFPVPLATAVSIVAGYLLLPTSLFFDVPLLPPYDRDLAAVLPALVMAAIKSRPAPPGQRPAAAAAEAPHMLKGWLPRNVFARACVFAIVGGGLMTSLTNADPLVYGWRVLQGLGLYEAASMIMTTLVGLLPFFVARKWFAHPREQVVLLSVLCGAALAYSLLALYEVRMSPQLNNMVYGFFPHSWIQHIRNGGYRPLVFLSHGLELGIFFAVCLIGTAGLLRVAPKDKRPMLWLALAWLFGTLVLCKTLGALIIAVVLLPVILLLGIRTQLMVAAIFAGLVLLYPTTRSLDFFPTERLLSFAASVGSPDRVNSLDFRFINEDMLLEHANERPLFGWGTYGRNRVFDENGNDISVTDGAWVILFGVFGWVGYLARFGLLTIPILLLMLRRRDDLHPASAALCVALAANLLDLLPNAGLTPITWLMAGAVVGRLELGRIEDEAPAAVRDERPAQTSPYRRSFPSAEPTRPDAAGYRRAGKPSSYRRGETRSSYR